MVSKSRPGEPGLSIVVAGASGLIGTALTTHLAHLGHSVHRFVRRAPSGPDEHSFDPVSGEVDQGIIDHADVVVNLSGASIGKIPWTKTHRAEILSSRVNATRTLAQAIARSESPPAVFLSGSAVGYYGSRGEEELTEESSPGDDYLAQVCVAWEEEAQAASVVTRVVLARTGLVIARSGAMAPLRLQTLLGVGGKTGPGTQWWPWISLVDEVRALAFLAELPTARGPYNLVAPTPARSEELTRELARLLHRPHLMGLPTLAINAVMGEAGRHLLLSGQKVHPTKLMEAGFAFDHPTVTDALTWMLEQN